MASFADPNWKPAEAWVPPHGWESFTAWLVGQVRPECRPAAGELLALCREAGAAPARFYQRWIYPSTRQMPGWHKLLTEGEWRRLLAFAREKVAIDELNRRNHEELNRPRATDRWPEGTGPKATNTKTAG
jgi:hypothetical protein